MRFFSKLFLIIIFLMSLSAYSSTTPESGLIIENRAEIIYYDDVVKAYNKKYSNIVSLTIASVIDFELTPKEIIIEKFRNEEFTLFHQIENKSNTDININIGISQTEDSLFDILEKKYYIDVNKNGIIDTTDLELKQNEIDHISFNIGETKNIIIKGKTPNVLNYGDFSTLEITASIPTIKTEVAFDKITTLAEPELDILGFPNKETSFQGDFVTFNFESKNNSYSDAIPEVAFVDSEVGEYIIIESSIPTNTSLDSRESGNEDIFVYHLVGHPENSYTTVKPVNKTLVDKVAFLYKEFKMGVSEEGSYSVKVNNNASNYFKTTYLAKYKKNILEDDLKITEDMIVRIPEIIPEFDNFNDGFKKIRDIIRITDYLNLRADVSQCNTNSSIQEEYLLNVETKLSKDKETNLKIKETSVNSGVFELDLIETRNAELFSVSHNNEILEILKNDEIYISLTCNDVSLNQTIFADPLSVVFDSDTDQPIANIKVILKGVDEFGETFIPEIFNLDGEEISNEQITDENGFFFFPSVADGTYKIEIQENNDYKYPSDKPLSFFGSNRLIDENGSFGKTFVTTKLNENNVILLDIPLDPIVYNNILIYKEADKDTATVGDIVEYSITINNLSEDPIKDLELIDTLPLGLDFISSEDFDYEVNKNIITFKIDEIAAKKEITVNYKVLVKINAPNGTGINVAQAFSEDYTSNIAKHKLEIEQESIFENPLIMGKVFKDCNDNFIKDDDEIGIPGVQIYLNNGYYAITDENGNYKFYNLKAKNHVVRVDKSSIPIPHSFKIINNKNARDPFSAFADLKYGELHRRDFRDTDCSPEAMLAVANRINNLKDIKTEVEKSAEKELSFDNDRNNDLKNQEDAGLIDEDESNINKIYLGDKEFVEKKLLPLPIIAQKDVLLAEDIRFDLDKYNVKKEYLNSISEIVDMLVKDPELNILLVGHTDSTASHAYNKVLSEKRSNSVKVKLTLAGIASERIETRGDGETNLKEKIETKEGAAKNRRVEIYYRKTDIGIIGLPVSSPSVSIPLVAPIVAPSSIIGGILSSDEDEDEEETPINVNVIKHLEPTIDLEAYAKNSNYNNELGFVDLEDDDIVSKDQISIRIKGRSSGNIQLLVNNKIVSEEKIGQIVNFKDKDLKIIEYVAVKLKTGLNIIETRIVDPFGNVRGSKAIKVKAVGELKKIEFNLPEGNKIPANNTKPFPVVVKLFDKNDFSVEGRYVITLSTSVGHWDVEDINEIESGIQTTIDNGEAVFDLIPPSTAEKGQIKAVINDIESKEDIFATTYLRDMFAVGIIEGAINLGSNELKSNISTTGLEEEVESFEITDGFNTRISLFLKGRVKGDFLLTLAYDSDKDSTEKLYKDIEPEEFYPIYGDSSINGFEGQSTSKLFVKIAKNNSYLMYGDYNTRDYDEKNVNLGNYNRTLTGIKHLYQRGKISINYYISEESFGSRIKEMESIGGFGPYDFSNGEDVIENSEKVTVITKDKNTGAVILEEPKIRFKDYEINGFYDGIVFREPIPTVDENFNPNYIKVEYETESDSEKYLVYGVKSSYQINQDISIGVHYNTSQEKDNEFEITSTNLSYDKNEIKANIELAESKNLTETGYGAKLNFKYNKKGHSADIRAEVADDKFNNEYSSVKGGKTNISIKTKNKINNKISIKNDIYYTKENELEKENKSIKTSLEKTINPNFRVEGGVRVNDNKTGADEYSSTMISGKTTWQPEYFNNLNVYAEYEQDVEISEVNRLEVGAEYSLSEKGSVYLKQERLSNMISEIEQSDTESKNIKTIIGTNYDITDSTELYSEYRIDEAINQDDAEAAIGVRNRFKINDEWEGNFSVERIEALEGEQTSSTSIATTFQHNKSKDWKTTYRFQYSNADSNDFYLASIGYIRKISNNYSLLLKDTIAFEEFDSSVRNKFLSGLSYRDNAYNELSLLFKYENDYLEENNFTDITNKLSTQFNKQINNNLTISGMYAIKNINSEIENYNYTGNWLASRFSYDINDTYDIGVSAAYLYDNETVDNYVFGLEAGYLFEKNMWISLGYNFEGLSDNKYSKENFHTQGIYVRFRMKLTEDNFKWLQ